MLRIGHPADRLYEPLWWRVLKLDEASSALGAGLELRRVSFVYLAHDVLRLLHEVIDPRAADPQYRADLVVGQPRHVKSLGLPTSFWHQSEEIQRLTEREPLREDI